MNKIVVFSLSTFIASVASATLPDNNQGTITESWSYVESNPTNNSNSNSNSSSNATGGSSSVSGVSSNSTSNATGGAGGSATVGNVSSSSTGGSSSVGNVSASTGASTSNASASADGAGANSNNVNITQNYAVSRIPVTSAYAASLTSGIDTCLGSASGGVQTQVVGLSLGKTTVDKNCVMIKQVQLLRELGMESAACFRARAGDEGKAIDDAMKAAGIDCNSLTRPVVSVPAAAPVVNAAAPVESKPNYVTHEELQEHEKRIVDRVIKK